MKSAALFGGKPPRVMQMEARRRPNGWREELLAQLHPLSREAFAVRREPRSTAEVQARERELAAVALRATLDDLADYLSEIEARCDEIVESQRSANPERNDATNLPGLVASETQHTDLEGRRNGCARHPSR
jgi:hypothetical protein